MEVIYEKWKQILQAVKEEHDISQVSFDTWLKPLEICTVKDNKLYILVPSAQLGVKYIARKYELPLKVAITESTGIDYELVFILPEQAKQLRSSASRKQTHSSETTEQSNLNSNYTFDTFVVGSNNRFAQSASLAVAESPGESYNPLYIYGGPGLGKTHLMHSIGNFIVEQNPDSRVLYVTSEEFTNEVIESIRSGNAAAMTKLREKYRTVDVLLLDDVQFIIGKESTQEEFFHTFNVLHTAGKQIILSSDKPPKEMETLEERFRSRFEWGLIADIQPPDYETRMAILRKNAEVYERSIDDEVIKYIATNVKSNIRELEGALNRVKYYALVNNSPVINLSLTETVMDDILPNKQKQALSPNLIKDCVSSYFNLQSGDLASPRRDQSITKPRHIAMYLCQTLLHMSLNDIGEHFGKRDHTTVLNGTKKITNNLKTDINLQKSIQELTDIINRS